tara:strand:- start:256 stop:1356 length:1101 start_codon:yes stop_codon:yes gene_type:complete
MTLKEFPSIIDEVSEAWLTEELKKAGIQNCEISHFDLEIIGQGVGIMGLLYRLSLTYKHQLENDDSDQRPDSLIIKIPAPHEQTRFVARTFMFYGKEVAFYKHAARDTPLGTPKCYSAHHDEESDDFILILEDLEGAEVFSQLDGCPIGHAEIAVEALARHHAEFWETPRFENDLSWVPNGWDPPFPQAVSQGFAAAWPNCMNTFGEKITSRIKEVGEKFPNMTSEMMEFNNTPVTLAHGDFRLDNIFFQGSQLKVIDWQICVRTVGGYDLGYFMSQSLNIEDRRSQETALLEKYRETLINLGINYPKDQLLEDYRRSVLFCLTYPVQASGVELVNERAVQLVTEMLNRVATAIEDLDSDEFLNNN